MTPEEQFHLIQRYYDGETVGAEAHQAEQLLASDPEAQKLLESFKDISTNIKSDVAMAVEMEDFSDYWAVIKEQLPAGPLTLQGGDEQDIVRAPVERLQPANKTSWRWSILRGPALAGLGVAVSLMALFLPARWLDFGSSSPVAVDYSIEIESIDSDGELVMVTQENDDVPVIIWVTETNG